MIGWGAACGAAHLTALALGSQQQGHPKNMEWKAALKK